MKMIGNDVYIQRGETWALDFDITNDKGDPFMILKEWQNPYIAITVAASLYEQEGDFRRTYWLDLNSRWVEKQNGDMILEPTKKFISTEPLYLRDFTIENILLYYGISKGGKVVADKNSDFDVTNYLFYIDPKNDGNRIYKHIKSYTYDATEKVYNAIWEDYNFRLIKQFNTKDWMEQGYLFDVKILAGESVSEAIARELDMEGKDYKDLLLWSDEDTQTYIDLISDDERRKELQELFNDGVPLMPNYDIKSLILQPTKLYVSVNIQGGVK